MDRRTYLENKFGGKDRAIQAYLPVVEHAKIAGLDIDLESITRTPNTLDAHRLIHWAGIEGRQTPVVSALFRAYFKDGRDIGNHEVLADIADTVGMDASLVQRLLKTDEDVQNIRERDAHARTMGVNSVPTFIVASDVWLDQFLMQLDVKSRPIWVLSCFVQAHICRIMRPILK